MPKKILFVILDGISDGLTDRKTSLQKAFKPKLDALARNGFAGLIENREGQHPDSGISIFTLLGYSKEDYPGRGYLDGLGVGLRQMTDTLYMRANFATVQEVASEIQAGEFQKKLIVIDRRAGRDKSGLQEMVDSIRSLVVDGMRVNFYKSLAHRGVITISSIDVSSNVSDSDPGDVNKTVMQIKPLSEDNRAAKTANTLNKWQHEVYNILNKHVQNKYRKIPANYILLRGASSYRYLKPFKESFGLTSAVIAASPVVKGIGRALEMNVINVSGATGDLNTDLRDKTLAALEALKKNDIVILHILGCDVAGHDRIQNVKSAFIEKIDREVFERITEYLDFEKTLLVVCSDHVTSVFTGMHEQGFLPFLIFGKYVKPNNVERFDELSCKLGPVINIEDFMEEILKFL